MHLLLNETHMWYMYIIYLQVLEINTYMYNMIIYNACIRIKIWSIAPVFHYPESEEREDARIHTSGYHHSPD